MDDPQLERSAGEDTGETINPQMLIIIAATIVMFATLIFGWVFAGRILDKLDEGIKSIGNQITGAAASVVGVGEIVVQEVLKGTGTVINQISGIVSSFEQIIGPLIDEVAKATDLLIADMAKAVEQIIGILNALGDTINASLNTMIQLLGVTITTAINDTLGFISDVFSPLFEG